VLPLNPIKTKIKTEKQLKLKEIIKMNFKNENNNNENMNKEVELNNNKGDLKMKLISEISTAQSKRFYNNKQTLRPIINNGQLKIIKTEVNKEALTYNEVTLRSGTINQLKHGVYDFYTKKTFKPQLINLNEFDEITLNINDIQKIKELRWAVYPHKSLNKNNPYYAKTGYLWGYQVVFIQQLYDEEVKLKVVAKDIEIILWLEELKNLKVSDLDHIGKLNQKELNDLKAIQYNLTDYDKVVYLDSDLSSCIGCNKLIGEYELIEIVCLSCELKNHLPHAGMQGEGVGVLHVSPS